jgi:hypothetical protein
MKFSTVFHTVPQNANITIISNVSFYFIKSVVVSSHFYLEKAEINVAIHLNLSAYQASAMAEIILIRPKNALFKYLESQNVTNCTPTADTLHVDVHVARIEKDKHTF